jgi:hypothetical protein
LGVAENLQKMKAKNITFEITNLTTKQGFIFRKLVNVDFDKAYKMIKKEFKGETILIESVKVNY